MKKPAVKAGKPGAKKPAAASSRSAPPKAKPVKAAPAKKPDKHKPAHTTSSKASTSTAAAAHGSNGNKPAPARPARPSPGVAEIRHASAKAAKPFKVPTGRALTEADVRLMSDADYMNEAQLEFFRLRLVQMREEVLAREVDVKERLNNRETFADPADRATAEEEHWLDLRLREREAYLLRKIDDALRRIAEKEYGYCEVTGEAIGIPRLLARPTATVCVDVKGQNEQIEAQYRDR